MASIRLLKKEISSIASDWATVCFFNNPTISDKETDILSKIFDFESECRFKSHIYANQKSKKEIKKYYNELYSDIISKSNDIIKDIQNK